MKTRITVKLKIADGPAYEVTSISGAVTVRTTNAWTRKERIVRAGDTLTEYEAEHLIGAFLTSVIQVEVSK